MGSKLTIDEIKAIVHYALGRFYEDDIDLLKYGVCEASMSHRIAVYLEQYFIDNKINDYHVDREYDKHINNGRDNDNLKILRHSKKRTHSHRPDIIIHKRGNNDNNLLFVEVKKNKGITTGDNDDLKLSCATSSKLFNYTLGLYLNIKEDKAEYTWYVNGEKEKVRNA